LNNENDALQNVKLTKQASHVSRTMCPKEFLIVDRINRSNLFYTHPNLSHPTPPQDNDPIMSMTPLTVLSKDRFFVAHHLYSTTSGTHCLHRLEAQAGKVLAPEKK
jgi:hypothetical protein